MLTDLAYLRHLGNRLRLVGEPASSAVNEVQLLLERMPALPLAEQSRLLAEVFARIAALPQTQEFGFQLGRAMPITAFGPMALALTVAPTLRDSLQLIAEHSVQAVPLLYYEYTPTPAGAAYWGLRFRCVIDEAAEALIVSAVFAHVHNEMQSRMPAAAVIERIELSTASRVHVPLYERLLGVRPSIAAPINRMLIPAAVLDLCNPRADVETYQGMLRSCAGARRLARRTVSMRERVLEQITTGIVAPPGLAEIAARLSLSQRQLRFALSKEGTSYRELLREARVELAESLLCEACLPVSRVAERLGYSDVAAFTHSFQRWTGRTPSQARRSRDPRR